MTIREELRNLKIQLKAMRQEERTASAIHQRIWELVQKAHEEAVTEKGGIICVAHCVAHCVVHL